MKRYVLVLLSLGMCNTMYGFLSEETVGCTIAQQNRMFDKFWANPVPTPSNILKTFIHLHFDINQTLYLDGQLSKSDADNVVAGWQRQGYFVQTVPLIMGLDLSKPVSAGEGIWQHVPIFNLYGYIVVASAQVGAPPFTPHSNVALAGSFVKLFPKSDAAAIPPGHTEEEYRNYVKYMAITRFLNEFVDKYANIRRGLTIYPIPNNC